MKELKGSPKVIQKLESNKLTNKRTGYTSDEGDDVVYITDESGENFLLLDDGKTFMISDLITLNQMKEGDDDED